jgi:hypothetical protein
MHFPGTGINNNSPTSLRNSAFRSGSSAAPERHLSGDGRFGPVTSFALDLEPSTGFVPLKSTWVQWHPSGRYIAVNLVDRNQVAFYEVERDQHGPSGTYAPRATAFKPTSFRSSDASRPTVATTLLPTCSGASTPTDSTVSGRGS